MDRALDVLIVEDHPQDAELMLAQLERAGYTPVSRRVEDEAGFRREVRRGADVVLTDCNLPRFDAFRALDLLREECSDIPCVVVTGSVGEDVAVDLMKRGAADYLLKDRLTRLPGAVEGALAAKRHRDEQRRTREHESLMMRELDHRVKNNLAVVLSLADQTAAGAADMQGFLKAFTGRVRALGRMHELLAAGRWEGMELGSLVTQILQPHTDASSRRVSLSGEPVTLPARTAPPVCMALHELATNAARHGALSGAGGWVRVEWERGGAGEDGGSERVRLRWREGGGPAVAAPTRSGFGRGLIEGSVPHEIGGLVSLRFEPGGVACDLEFPLVSEEGVMAGGWGGGTREWEIGSRGEREMGGGWWRGGNGTRFLVECSCERYHTLHAWPRR